MWMCLFFVSFLALFFLYCSLIIWVFFRIYFSMLSDFGDQAVKVTLDHFRPLLEKHGVDVDRAEIEWPQLRHAIYKWWVLLE